MPNHSGNDFRQARKHQTIREMIFAMRGNSKSFGKWFSPSAEMPNLSGNDFRQPRKCQTFREMTFANRGNSKPFKKWFAGGPQATKPLKNDLQIKILLLHQKDKLKNKIKQDHFKWVYRATLHDYNRASLNEPKGNHFRWVFPPLRSKRHPTKFVFFAF